MLEKFLEEIGFSEKEAAIYLYLLKVESAATADIAKHTDVNRTTVYPVVEQLIKKDFVVEVDIKGKTHYRARTPDRIESYLQEQKIKIEEQTHQAVDIIPQLKGVMRLDGEKPIIEYHEGREAILNSANLNFFGKGEEGDFYIIYPRDRIEELFTDKERSKGVNSRINANIKANSIYTYSKGEYVSKLNAVNMHLDAKEYPISADISVFSDKVKIHILGKDLGTIYIKSKDVADTLRTLFRLAFKNGKN